MRILLFYLKFRKLAPCRHWRLLNLPFALRLISPDCSAIRRHSQSADLLRKSLLPHVLRHRNSEKPPRASTAASELAFCAAIHITGLLRNPMHIRESTDLLRKSLLPHALAGSKFSSRPVQARPASAKLGSLTPSYYAFRFRASDILLLRATSYSLPSLAAVRSADSRFPANMPAGIFFQKLYIKIQLLQAAFLPSAAFMRTFTRRCSISGMTT